MLSELHAQVSSRQVFNSLDTFQKGPRCIVKIGPLAKCRFADPNLMAQVLAGLLTNAAQAVPIGGKVRIGCHQEDSFVELAVEDSGPGVPPDLYNRIFEPFFTTRASGIGLGLAIARQIAEAHGSSIKLGESSTGGARFSVMLPCTSLV